MTQWLRWWHGAFSDPKLHAVALRAKASRSEVVAIWAGILEHASQQGTRGDVGEPAEEIAIALALEIEVVERVMKALEDKWGVKAAPVAVAGAAGPAAAAAVLDAEAAVLHHQRRQQHHQRCPVPHIHQQHREPRLRGVAGVAVVEAQRREHAATRADQIRRIEQPAFIGKPGKEPGCPQTDQNKWQQRQQCSRPDILCPGQAG